MKSLSELKRTIQLGTKIEQIKRVETVCDVDGNRTLQEVPIPNKLRGVRTVTKINTTGFYMAQPTDQTNGSILIWPRASNLVFEADGTFTVIDRTKEGKIWLKMTYKIIT